MICQSWKVMFQAEYSSGSPLRMLVDLRASVEHGLGRGKASEVDTKASPAGSAKPAAASKAVPSVKPGASASVATKPVAPPAKAAAATATSKPSAKPIPSPASKAAQPAAKGEAPEFEVSGTPGWDPDSAPQAQKKK
jgi:hypothetical protein